MCTKHAQFQSTLPAKGATGVALACRQLTDVSIHAPREGSDIKRGSRGMILHVFQSTLPAKGSDGYE